MDLLLALALFSLPLSPPPKNNARMRVPSLPRFFFFFFFLRSIRRAVASVASGNTERTLATNLDALEHVANAMPTTWVWSGAGHPGAARRGDWLLRTSVSKVKNDGACSCKEKPS